MRSGENLTTICGRHYGDASLVEELAIFNNMGDPDRIITGVRLRIPPASSLVRGTPAAAPRGVPSAATRAPTATKGTTQTYRIRSGDMLSKISLRLLGSARHWRGLYELNRDVIDDPDHLEVGVVIQIPGDQ